MKRINAYETTDGTVFSDRKEAKAHQQHIDVLDALTHVAENNKLPRPTNGHLADFLHDNIEAIAMALKGEKFDFAAQEAKQAAVSAEVTASIDADLNDMLTELADMGDAESVNRDAEPVAIAA